MNNTCSLCGVSDANNNFSVSCDICNRSVCYCYHCYERGFISTGRIGDFIVNVNVSTNRNYMKEYRDNAIICNECIRDRKLNELLHTYYKI